MDLPREVCLYSGVDWLNSSVSQRVARGQLSGAHVSVRMSMSGINKMLVSDRDAHFDCDSCPAFICSDVYVFPKHFRAQKMCESRGCHPGLYIPNSPYAIMVSVDVKRE